MNNKVPKALYRYTRPADLAIDIANRVDAECTLPKKGYLHQ